MPVKAKELSAKAIRDLRHPGYGKNHLFPVGGVSGLGLQITPSGARSWILRTMVRGKRRWIGLGPYPEVSLADARTDAKQYKRNVRAGLDTSVEEISFEEAMQRYLATKLREFRNEKHRAQWSSTLERYALPHLGRLTTREIKVNDVLTVLQPLWSDKTETASRLRGRIEGVLAWATVSGFREGDNPARWSGNLDAILPKPSKLKQASHHPALSLKAAPTWFGELQEREGTAARALEFAALTAARSGEVRHAQWTEIDLEGKVWTIPAQRMKAQKEHRVPLADAACRLLKTQPKTSDWVFPNKTGVPLSDMALSAVMRRMNSAGRDIYVDPRSKRPAVPHGLRSTFRDWAAVNGYDRDMTEIALAHTVGTEVERAYRRTDMIERRRSLMHAWEDFLSGETLCEEN